MTDQSTDTTKVQCDEPMSFIGLIYRNMDEELFRAIERTQRTASPRPTQACMTAHKARNLNTAHPQLKRLESALSWCLSWSKFLPGSSDCFCSFSAAGQISGSALQLRLTSSGKKSWLLLFTLVGLVNLVRDFLKLL